MSNADLKTIPILLVDDDANFTNALMKRLVAMGHTKIDTARNGEVAFNLCVKNAKKRDSFQIIISDWRMPRMSGLDLLNKVRCHPDLRDCLFMIVTGVHEVSNVKRALSYEVNQYLLKPFKGHEFDQKVESMVATIQERLRQ